MKKNKLVILLMLMIGVHYADAQRGVCGVSTSDQDVLVDQIKTFKKNLPNLEMRRSEDRFVSLAFTRIGRTDGSGKVRKSAILNQVARMNVDFEETGIQFYLASVDEIGFELNSNTLYNGVRGAGSVLNAREIANSINIFVAESDVVPPGPNDPPTPRTLGFWTPQFDHLFLRIDEAEANTATLSHEIGHFFSLVHTHRGWDSAACNRNPDTGQWDESIHGNPLRSGTSPGGVPVERADGSNCDTAGDLLCDTPADYNFGLTNPSNCVFSRNQADHNGDQVDPQEENYMGYFIGCAQYIFSPMQQEMMLSSYESSGRNYIRTGYTPVNDELVGTTTMISPENREQLDYYDQIEMIWEEVEGATHYLIEMNANSVGFEEDFITTEPRLFLDELEPDTRYSFRIYPYNEGNTDFGSVPFQRFTTGNLSVGVRDVEAIDKLNIYPNPLEQGQTLNLSLSARNAFEAQVRITALDGSVVYEQPASFREGSNVQKINTQDISSGLFIISIETPQGVSQQKVIIK